MGTEDQEKKEKRAHFSKEQEGQGSIEDVKNKQQADDIQEQEEERKLPVVTEEQEEESKLPIIAEEQEEESMLPVITEEAEEESTLPVITEEAEEESALPVVTEEAEEESTLPVITEEAEEESTLPVVTEEQEEESTLPVVTEEQEEAKTNEGPITRAERREERLVEEAEASEIESTPTKKQRIRLIPIWLRIIVVTVLAGAALLIGMVIGFGVVGDGENMWDVLNPDLWYNILDTIRGD